MHESVLQECSNRGQEREEMGMSSPCCTEVCSTVGKKRKKKERNFLDFTIFIMTYTGTVLEYSYIVDRLHCIPCFTSFFKQVKKKNQKSRRSHEVGDALFGSFLFYFIFPFKTTPSVGTLSYVWTSHECGV